jgi:hypothetical protein
LTWPSAELCRAIFFTAAGLAERGGQARSASDRVPALSPQAGNIASGTVTVTIDS